MLEHYSNLHAETSRRDRDVVADFEPPLTETMA